MKNISLFYQNITVLDCGFLDLIKGPVGHSFYVDVKLVGKVDDQGILFDFSDCKKQIKSIIDEYVDHRLLVPQSVHLEKIDQEVKFQLDFAHESRLFYRAPEQSLCIIPSHQVTESNVTTYLEQLLIQNLPENIINIEVNLRSELLEKHHDFHYTHGLKNHGGNCQRVLHGHRNKIEVFVNGKQSKHWEEFLAVEVFRKNIHFCLIDNIENLDEVSSYWKKHDREYGRCDGVDKVKIKYPASQGEFYCELPGSYVYVMPLESTIENISYHFAEVIKTYLNDTCEVEVYAYEGIGKGASYQL